ncbi:cytochrome P450 [Rhodotorula paludigena]|uniref:cytochrome P450 n=1 Tax=Rhodotorula paludigena TaxID=86838 RepID=UPI0031815C37
MDIPLTPPVLLGTILTLTLGTLCFLWARTAYPSNLPPGPRASHWGWGNHRHLIPRERPWLRLHEIGKEYERGYFTVWTGPKPTIVVSSAKVAADLLDKRSSKYSSRPRFVVAGELATGGDAMLFLPYGQKWRNQRKIYHAALMEKRADDYRPIQEMEAKRLCADFLHLADSMGWEKHIERFSASSVVAIAYGRRVDDAKVGFVQSVIKRMEEVGKTNLPGKQILDAYPFLQSLPEFLTPYKKTWRAARAESHGFWMSLADTVKERMHKGTAAPSFTRDLLEKRDQLGISDQEFALLTGGIFGAGVDTTSGTLIAFVLAMVTHPDVQRKAQEELDRVVGPNRSPTWEDESSLPYCRAVVQETLRWRPVAILGGTPHASTEDDVYDGYLIPAGSTILCNTYAIHRDPVYFPDPDLFRPERYLEDEKETGIPAYPQKAGHSAFGWGRRICPGMHVAERGVTIVILHLLHHFVLSSPEGAPKPDIHAFTDGFNSRAEPFPIKAALRGGKEKRELVEREKEEAWEALQAYEV